VRLPVTAEGIPSHPGVVASAARLVQATPELAELPEHLLGDTLVVQDLAVAREIAALTSGFRFVTLRGEILEPNGLLTVGEHHAETGILSRKSELRELRQQAVDLDERIAATERHLGELRAALAQLDSAEQESAQQVQLLGERSADLRSRLTQQRQRHEGLAQELELSQTELQQINAELHTLQQGQQTAELEARQADERSQQLHQRIDATDAALRELDQQRHQGQQSCTAAKVSLAGAEERRSASQARFHRARQDWQQQQAEQRRQQDHLAAQLERQRHSQLTQLQAAGELALACLDKEKAEQELNRLQQDSDRIRLEKQQQIEQSQSARQRWQELQEQAHTAELQLQDHQHRMDGLAARLREEHELDLLELYRDYRPPAQAPDPAAAQEEITELKRKISRLGSVSLDALQELAELETRSQSLQSQHDDLIAAKKALDEIIGKINQDSRKLFSDTFTTIRGHFQELFRKLFGGGMADVVLEDETDLLESGIEIIARPPGKELRSISLLSGGEKTLTAVALLLAIFRSKPSPFCILDEVDAALDEANIGRYTAVLREFLDRSQFIIVTHSKKTMAAADVLYGVTMQESGVSKRVAVRFEDWPDEQSAPPAAAEDDSEVELPADDQEESAA
jgi:chromosome segregation protein